VFSLGLMRKPGLLGYEAQAKIRKYVQLFAKLAGLDRPEFAHKWLAPQGLDFLQACGVEVCFCAGQIERDRIDEQDRNWFKQHPQRTCFARRTQEVDCAEDGIPFERCWTLVKRKPPGISLARFITENPTTMSLLSDEALSEIFDGIKERMQ
jgi:hypothetical protein